MAESKGNKQSIQQFKQFVKKHPKIVREVREGKHTWKEFYEDWYIFGEDDEMWQSYKSETQKHSNEEKSIPEPKKSKSNSNAEFIGQLTNMIKNVDMNQLQYHISSLSGALANIQQLVEQFQSNNQVQQHSQQQPERRDPFSFRKD